MKKRAATLSLTLLTGISLLCINGCDVGEFFDLVGKTDVKVENRNSKKTTGVGFDELSAETVKAMEQEETKKSDNIISRKPIEILHIFRPDYYAGLIDGVTQRVHLAGIVSPDTQRDAHTLKFAEKFELNDTKMPEVAREAVAFLEGLIQQQERVWLTYNTVTSKEGKHILEGDILLGVDSYLTDALLSRGYAHIYKPPENIQWRLEMAQNKARMEEKGIWYNPVTLERRFFVRTHFDDVVLNTTKNRQMSSDGTKLIESHRTEERQGVVNIGISVMKPVARPYEGTIYYSFVQREEKGTRRQEKTAAPINADSIPGAGGRNDLSSHDQKEEQERENRIVNEYNKTVKDQRIFDDNETNMRKLQLVIDTPETNITLRSGVQLLTKSRKAGFDYEQGSRYVGYNLDIYIGTNLIYHHRHNE